MSIMFSLSTYAAQTTVFGPRKIKAEDNEKERGGEHNHSCKRGQSYSKSFSGFFDGAVGSLILTQGDGYDIPTTPCTGTPREIMTCNRDREKKLRRVPLSVEILLNGQTIVANGQIPRTQGRAILPVVVNGVNQIQVKLNSNDDDSFIKLEITSEDTPPPPPSATPTADFTFTPATGTAPLFVSFDALSSSSPNGAIASYAWDYGDGATDAGAQVGHYYFAGGSYNVILTVTDSLGLTDTKTSTLVVTQNQLPACSFTYNIDTSTGALIVNANATGSIDSDGTIVGYYWGWGDGATSTGVMASHGYVLAGTYHVTLDAVDNSGAWCSTAQDVLVQAPALP
jgi:PKD repeat protein